MQSFITVFDGFATKINGIESKYPFISVQSAQSNQRSLTLFNCAIELYYRYNLPEFVEQTASPRIGNLARQLAVALILVGQCHPGPHVWSDLD